MKKNIFRITILVSLLVLLGVLTSCSNSQLNTITKDIVLKNTQGTYTYAQLIIPENYKDEKLPLVTLGHGFGGTMDSAGGKHLASALARAGFATIRMDYKHYLNKSLKKSENQYTIDSMVEDQILCIKYMEKNYNIDANNIGLYGRSLGGRVAMKMANESAGGYDYKAMALIAPAGNDTALIHYMHGEKKWQSMKNEAASKGYVIHQKVKLTPEFFSSIDDYIPSKEGSSFDKNVLVIYNTLDYVVLPECSKECAKAYKNSELVEVTTKNYHGYEMGYKKSELKDKLTLKLINFFKDNL